MNKALNSRPLTQMEFEQYEKELLIWYTEELITSGICTPENAEATAKEDIVRLCPNGLESPNCYFQYLLSDKNEEIGFLWYCLRKIDELEEKDIIFICDVKIFEVYRGQGYGRALMEYVEAETRNHNLDKIILNVFDKNEVAKNLYTSMGYEVIHEGIGSAAMLKNLS